MSELPEGWQEAQITELVTLPSGQADPRDVQYRSLPLVAPNHIESGTGRLIQVQSAETQQAISGKYLFKSGDVLYSKIRPYLRKATLARFDGLCSADMYPLQASAKILPGYLLAVVLGDSFTEFATSVSMRTGIPKINREELAQFKLPVPPISEQRKIAAILSSVDDTIEKIQAVIDELEAVKKVMMQELLTRGMPGRHTAFKMTDDGEVPVLWDFARLGDVCERMFVGIAQAATHAYVETGGVPLIRTTNLRPNEIHSKDLLRISDAFAETMNSKALRHGDVLSARTGNPGTSAVVPPELDGAQCFTLLVSRPGPQILGRYLCHVMNSTVGTRIVSRGQAGGAQQNLNVTVFQEARVPLPSVAEQQEIVDIIDALYAREQAEETSLEHLSGLKSALLSLLLTGEIRVTPDPEPTP